MMRRLVIVGMFLAAMPLAAQVRFEPPNPVAGQFIRAIVSSPTSGFRLLPVEIVGSEIRFTVRGNGVFPIVGQHPVIIGPLPAGTYSAVVIHQYEDEVTGEILFTNVLPAVPLIVAPGVGSIPALDPGAIALLAGALAIAGFFAVRRL